MKKTCSLIGNRYGALLVIKKAGKTKKHNRQIWMCKCDCGNTTKATHGHLTSGNRSSCGCRIHRRKYLKTIEELCAKDQLGQYKKGAKKRRYCFKLTKKDMLNLLFDKCYYCGSSPSNTFKLRKNTTRDVCDLEIKYNGVDRVDNKTGYVLYNCVTCCKTCNIMKQQLGKYQFLNHIKKILNNITKAEKEDVPDDL